MLLLLPGPVQTRPETRAAMGVDIGPWDDEFRAVVAALRERLRVLAGGREGEHVALPLQGSGHFVVEAALRSFVPPGGKVLVPVNGTYGRRIERLGREAGRAVVTLPCPDTAPVPPEAVAAALAADPAIGHVAVVQSETGSGVVNDVAAIGAVARGAGRRMILDSVSAFGALPFDIGAHPECDALVFTSGKCLEGMPGLACAVARIDRLGEPGQAGSWCLDLADVYRYALAAGWGRFRFTPPAQVVSALSVAVDLHEAEGGSAVRLARYANNARIFHAGVRELGLTPYLPAEQQGPVIVNVRAPDDPAWDLQRFATLLKTRGVMICNFYTTETPGFRVGCIGAVAEEAMRYALAAMRSVLDEMGLRRREAA
ncbi:2-aminoethylphosphonate--pyruvate transaminase [Roseomonas sp. NAR14]|uniref:2-aminoethylphosphonate--pyruvate transaminase n=1 Tax=Roseomonas acroporae TaxID=2937791 RepID=A0A9X1YAK8_9PROT|nr:2-aminoethylphosphonate--pyruvate transaminase [Roseomonas acroporae]MCK8782926.1 2-aminoethylphosphonate--pyruvate transaminase [Roseomonas acroporae]